MRPDKEKNKDQKKKNNIRISSSSGMPTNLTHHLAANLACITLSNDSRIGVR
jgi:hypothetical protein